MSVNFAILLTAENMPKIEEAFHIPTGDARACAFYLRLSEDHYVVRGYVDREGKLWEGITIFPAFFVKQHFEIDVEHASTDWDQIVRKPR